MNKKIIFVIFLLVLFSVFVFINKNSVREDVYDSEYFSGDTVYENSNSYDIFVNDDTITYYDENGNSVIYLFDADRLSGVYSIYVSENEVEAKKIANYFLEQVGNGEISEVVQNENTVTVVMDMNYFAEYSEYTKKQIEEILFKNAKIVEGE